MSLSRSIAFDRPVRRLVQSGGGAVSDTSPAADRRSDAEIKELERRAFAAGEAKAGAEAETRERQFRDLWGNFERNLDEYLDNLEVYANGRITEFGLRIAEIILMHRLPDADMTAEVIREIVGKVTDFKAIKVRLHPRDAELLSAAGAPDSSTAGKIEIVMDPTLSCGDVIVENGFGLFDATLSQRFDLLRGKLAERTGRAHAK